MRSARDLFVTAFAWTVTGLLLLLLVPVLAVLVLLTRRSDPARRRAGRWFHGLGRVLVRLVPTWSFHVENRSTAPFHEPSILVSNHESDADVFLSAFLPWDAKYLAKDTIYNIPVMGWAMRLAGDIGVVRGDPVSRAMAREACRAWLRRGVSVVLYPEGTRSRTGELGPFREGACRLAVEEGVPLQPFVVAGTRDMLPPETTIFRPARGALRILDPVPVDGLGADDVAALTERVRTLLLLERDALRRELAGGRGGVDRLADGPPRGEGG